MLRDMRGEQAKSFPNIQTKDLAPVAESRHAKGLPRPAANDDPDQRARSMDLIGLAFSGGGIRSATFNLGILQGLANRNLIPHIDYLSTVSGGGYIGAWLTAWICRGAPIPQPGAREKLGDVQSSLQSE